MKNCRGDSLKMVGNVLDLFGELCHGRVDIAGGEGDSGRMRGCSLVPRPHPPGGMG